MHSPFAAQSHSLDDSSIARVQQAQGVFGYLQEVPNPVDWDIVQSWHWSSEMGLSIKRGQWGICDQSDSVILQFKYIPSLPKLIGFQGTYF